MKAVIKQISDAFMNEAVVSPRMLEDLAAMEKYMSESYDGRTFVELLQNADDAGASRVKVFTVGADLIVANDGRPFDENDIMAICRSGSSSKQRGSSIGYRGVGFKSATTISTEIIIYSADTYFTFSKSICAGALNKSAECVPTVRIPFLYEESLLPKSLSNRIDDNESDGYTTFFIFKDAKINKFLSEFDGFNSGWLLFLKNVNRVEIDCGIKKELCRITRKKLNATDSLINVIGGKNQWYLVSDNNVTIAFKYDSDKGILPCSCEEGVFHCFLPTIDKAGFSFKINADFTTDPSRKHIIRDDRTIEALARLSMLYSNFILRIITNRKQELYAAISILTTHTTLNDIVTEFENNILDQLRKMSWVLLQDGNMVVPADACIYTNWMLEDERVMLVEAIPEFSHRFVDTNLLSKVNKSDVLLQKLGAKSIGSSEFQEIMTSKALSSKLPQSLYGKVFVYGVRSLLSRTDELGNCFVPLLEAFVELKNTSEGQKISEEFATSLKALLNPKEIDKLMQKYSIFSALRQQKKSSAIKTLKRGSSDLNVGTMAKTAKLAINKWKTPVQNCMAIEGLNGFTVKDAGRKCDEYNLISTGTDGSVYYIAVKSVGALGDSFKLTEHEYAAAQRLGNSYKVYVISTETSEVEYMVIENPVDSLKMEKVVKEWEWICNKYNAENQNDVSGPEYIDEKIMKEIKPFMFNAPQREFLLAYMQNKNILFESGHDLIIDQINFVFDFHTGELFFEKGTNGITVQTGKITALRRVFK